MTAEDIQENIYNAARGGDRASVNRLLKDLILTSDRDEDTKRAFSVTIDMATQNMATLSLTVLCFQARTHGLFRYLAERDPKEMLRIAPGLAAAFGDVSFAKPVAALGADKSFMEGPLLVQAVAAGDIETVRWMIAEGVDVNAQGDGKDKPVHPLLAAGKIENADIRAKMQALIFESGIGTAEGTAKEALEAYDAMRQERIAANAQAHLKARAHAPGLRLKI